MNKPQKLELVWTGKDKRPRLEPRILLEDCELSYHREPPPAAPRDLLDEASEPPKSIDNNLLIQGDNLLALKALEARYAGKVKCIFIDPPYNTGSAFTHYDDGVEHSMWLTMMRDRLELLRTLLSEDGSIWITIDDNEVHYLKVLCDEVFGRSNFVANLVWEKRTSRENRRVFSFNHDHLLVYGKKKAEFERVRNPLGLNAEVLARYKNPDGDSRGPWQSVSANAQAGHATASQFYKLTLPSGREVEPPKGRCWLYTQDRMMDEIKAGNIWFGVGGDNAPRIKKFLDVGNNKGLTPETIWPGDEVGTNDDAKKGFLQLLPDLTVFDNPKPEGLLERAIHIATNPGDLVLDSFAGSGTTGAVAHKMGRRWIMVELGEHCRTHIVPRLKKVIDGEDAGGVTQATGWKGGGGYRYYRLAPSLLKKDHWNNWVINPSYNAEMLAEAMCRHMGYTYAPSAEHFWMHGYSTEASYIYVTTGALSHEQLHVISVAVGPERALMICCTALRSSSKNAFANLSLRKIPRSVLGKCEWDQDDYSFSIDVLAAPEAPLDDADLDEDEDEALEPNAE